jgi:hypothetical protein
MGNRMLKPSLVDQRNHRFLFVHPQLFGPAPEMDTNLGTNRKHTGGTIKNDLPQICMYLWCWAKHIEDEPHFLLFPLSMMWAQRSST